LLLPWSPLGRGVLTGKYTVDSKFPEGDFRNTYFAGDRLERAVKRVEKIKETIADTGMTLPEVALKFALAHPAVSTVIPGIRSVSQAESNIAASDSKPLSDELILKLHDHAWRRGSWYSGK